MERSRSCDFGHRAQPLLAASWTQMPKDRKKKSPNSPAELCHSAAGFGALEMRISNLGAS